MKRLVVSAKSTRDVVIKNRIAEILEEIGESQQWLADETGISKASISKFINNEIYPKISGAYKICKALNKDFFEVFYNENEEDNNEEQTLKTINIEAKVRGKDYTPRKVLNILEKYWDVKDFHVYETENRIINNKKLTKSLFKGTKLK